MKASEIDSEFGYYDPNEDSLTMAQKTDVRKGDISLADVNKLKKIRATRRIEKLQRNGMLEIIYGGGGDSGGGGGLGL